jgi:uncharacterized membrane protein
VKRSVTSTDSSTPSPPPGHSGRALDRLINFTDAVVAVAITVLVLPLIDLRAQGKEKTVWAIISDNSGQIITFIFTFVVVAVMWRVHNRVFNRLAGFDNVIFWFNLAWLLAIAFLPWSSVMYGVGIDNTSGGSSIEMWSGGEGLGGAGLLYWTNLAAASFTASLISWHAHRHPNLIDADAPRIFQDTPLVRARGALFGGYFLLTGITSLFAPQIALWMPLGILVLAPLISRREVEANR